MLFNTPFAVYLDQRFASVGRAGGCQLILLPIWPFQGPRTLLMSLLTDRMGDVGMEWRIWMNEMVSIPALLTGTNGRWDRTVYGMKTADCILIGSNRQAASAHHQVDPALTIGSAENSMRHNVRV